MKVVALAGGVGGARLADGLAACLPADDLTVIVNTGDDFKLFDLAISPDIDTVCYTLSGLANEKTGWGVKDDTWNALGMIGKLEGPVWFHLGDKDIGLHIERTRRLKSGQPLSQVTADFCTSMGIGVTVLPMTDDSVGTMVDTREYGEIPFQDYFVRLGCDPTVTGFRFDGISSARPAKGCLEAIEAADLIIFCPSNPWVSIGPILSLPSMSESLRMKTIVAVSPIIGGKAVKGPAAKMYREMGINPSALEVARQYREYITGFMLDKTDEKDSQKIRDWGIKTCEADIIMVDRPDRKRLAGELLKFCESINN